MTRELPRLRRTFSDHAAGVMMGFMGGFGSGALMMQKSYPFILNNGLGFGIVNPEYISVTLGAVFMAAIAAPIYHATSNFMAYQNGHVESEPTSGQSQQRVKPRFGRGDEPSPSPTVPA